MIERVTATPAVRALLARLAAKHGPLVLHLSGGCCDGSAPICLPRGDFHLGNRDLCLGWVEGTPLCMADDTYGWWEHSEVQLDVIEARGGGFSLEVPDGVRLVARSRLFTDEELPALRPPVPAGTLPETCPGDD